MQLRYLASSAAIWRDSGYCIEKLFSWMSFKGSIAVETTTRILGALLKVNSQGKIVKKACGIENSQYFPKESSQRKAVSAMCRGYFKSLQSSFLSASAILCGQLLKKNYLTHRSSREAWRNFEACISSKPIETGTNFSPAECYSA